MKKDVDVRYKIGIKVSIVTIIGNSILSAIKILIGFISNSTAMLADGVHSLSDVLTTIGVIIGLKLSSKKPDKCHPYGHEKFESISSLFLGFFLFILAIGISYSGIIKIVTMNYVVPGVYAIYAAIVSIVTKEIMYHYTMNYAIKIKSPSLKADAWHHRSDSLSSIGALVGIIGARLGFPMLDSVAAIIIGLVIIKVSIDILRESIVQLIDKSASDEIVNSIRLQIDKIDGVVRIDNLKTRIFSSKIYVDVEISVDSTLTVEEGHNIAMEVHNKVENQNKDIKHCMVHVNPYIYQ